MIDVRWYLVIPKAATVPSLGLSNKAVYHRLNNDTEPEEVSSSENNLSQYDAPPMEETLMENTLWPEVQKLYAHGYEIYSLAATNDGRVLASACRSARPEFAQVILW